jgi:hypothetical protein
VRFLLLFGLFSGRMRTGTIYMNTGKGFEPRWKFSQNGKIWETSRTFTNLEASFYNIVMTPAPDHLEYLKEQIDTKEALIADRESKITLLQTQNKLDKKALKVYKDGLEELKKQNGDKRD